MGVGDYVHSKEGGQPRGAPSTLAAQSRQQRADLAKVEVPPLQFGTGTVATNGRGAPLESQGVSQFPHQPRTITPHGGIRDRDVFDTDVEAIDDSTVAGTSVYGFDDNKSQAASSTNAAFSNHDLQPMYQPRPARRTHGSYWYEGLGGQSKHEGFGSDGLEDFGSPFTSSAGEDGADDEKTDEATGWQMSHKPRTTEEPLSKRLENFWSATKRNSSRQPITIDSDPEPQADSQPKPKPKPRKLGQMLPPTGPRKVVLPQSTSATPRTRFSPPKPSLLEQLDKRLDISPTRQHSQPPADLSRPPSVIAFRDQTDSDGGSDDGIEPTIRVNERRDISHSTNPFDMTSLTELDVDDTMQDPLFGQHAHEHSTRGRRNTIIHNKKRPLEADYPPEVLYQKSFSELQAEPFDKSPTPPPVKSPSLPPNPPPFVPDTHEPKNAVSHLLASTEQERQNYLSHMTMDEWEDCGDQMIDRFTHLLSEMKNLRRARRHTAAVFEGEVKRRHDQIETQNSELTNKLTEMRSGGAEVLRGRYP